MNIAPNRPTKCEWCGDSCQTEEHHIAQGKDRKFAIDNMACVIFLCHDCHQKIQGIRDSRMIGLAILMVRRRDDFSLQEFYRVTERRWPDLKDIHQWRKRLSLPVE